MDRVKQQLKDLCKTWGIDLFGVADISRIKEKFQISPRIKEKIKCAISLGVRVSKAILEEIENHPTKLYFHHYRCLNFFLDQSALRLANVIQHKGHLALPIPASQILDWQRQKAHLSHKEIAYLAGLGWIGRNNLLVNKDIGAQLRLVSILTDMSLQVNKPSLDNCADCYACLSICPAGAIEKEQKKFKHLACFEKLRQFQKDRYVSQYICGICIKVCSGRQRYDK
jgi:epoxyqueuosine reductase QueG